MSTGDADEIVFGEMSFREPVRMRRPDRDPRRTCIAYQNPGPYDLPVFLERAPADHIERHALRDTSVELGGILLGKECTDEETGEPFVLVTEALEAKHYENTQASFTYTHESWEQITRERDEKFPDLDIVGWYHTHPDFGVFLSSHDLFIHHHFFAQNLQVAYVVDPIRQTRGFFQWRDGQMVQVRGFFLTSDRAERLALARLVNELEGLPSSDGGGGGFGLSPRLEAELIAMLSRPHVAPAVDRGQTAAVFSLLGVTLGALAVGGLFWLYTLGNTLRDQSTRLTALEKGVQDTQAVLEDAVAGARISAKEQALDAVLARVGPAETTDSLRGLLTKAAQEQQALLDRIARLETEKDALGVYADEKKAEVTKVANDLAALRSRTTKEAKELQGKLDESDQSLDALRNQVAQQEQLIKDSEAGTLAMRYNVAFWMAVGGWMACLMALLGVISLWNRVPPDEEIERGEPFRTPEPPPNAPQVKIPPSGPPPGRQEPPPHVIE